MTNDKSPERYLRTMFKQSVDCKPSQAKPNQSIFYLLMQESFVLRNKVEWSTIAAIYCKAIAIDKLRKLNEATGKKLTVIKTPCFAHAHPQHNCTL